MTFMISIAVGCVQYFWQERRTIYWAGSKACSRFVVFKASVVNSVVAITAYQSKDVVVLKKDQSTIG